MDRLCQDGGSHPGYHDNDDDSGDDDDDNDNAIDDGSWKSVQDVGKMAFGSYGYGYGYAVISDRELFMEYPQDFSKRMELVQSMMKLVKSARL